MSTILEPVRAGLVAAHEVDVAELDSPDLERAVSGIRSVQASLAGLIATLLGEWVARQLWVGHGSQSAAAALAFRQQLPIRECRKPIRLSNLLREAPELLAALCAGEITMAHVERISACDNPRTHADLIADHPKMAVWARTLTWKHFDRELLDWLEEHDQDGVEPEDLRRRKVKVSQTIDGAWFLTAVLTAVGGAVFVRELDRLATILFKQDWKEARERLGRDPLPTELVRTDEQRRHDALILMAERSATLPEDGRRGQPLFIVLVGDKSLATICELTNGSQVRPSQVAPHLADAVFETIVFDGPFKPIKVSKQRTYRDVLRRVVMAMYRGCVDPGCDASIDRCEVDHDVPYSKGGPTSWENGRPRCRPSNQEKGSRSPPPDEDDPDWFSDQPLDT